MDLLPGWYLPGLLHPDRPVHQLPHCPPQGSAPGGVVQQLVLFLQKQKFNNHVFCSKPTNHFSKPSSQAIDEE